MKNNSPSQGLADPEYAEELIDKVGSGLLSHGVMSYKVVVVVFYLSDMGETVT